MRALLILSVRSPALLSAALDSAADGLLLDLGAADAAAPAKARAIVHEFLIEAHRRPRRPNLYVGIHKLDSGLADADLDAVLPGRPDGVALSHAEGGVDVQHLAAKLAVREAENNLADGVTRILCLAAKTASALLALASYRGASRRLSALAWDGAALYAALGGEAICSADGGGAPYRLARTLVLAAAAAADVPAIDALSPHSEPHSENEAEFIKACQAARRDGFAGKLAANAAQVALINAVFTPTPAQIIHAQTIVAAFAAAPEVGVAFLEGEPLDRNQLERANKLLARHARCEQDRKRTAP